MNTHANKSRYLLRLIVGIAVILFGTAGIARMMGWGPNSTRGSSGILAFGILPTASAKPVAATVQTTPGGDTRGGRCAECGVIMSMREIGARDEGAGLDASGGTAAGKQDELPVTSARRYEITIRLTDRSSRVINHASPASWRPGERVIVIDGANPSHR